MVPINSFPLGAAHGVSASTAPAATENSKPVDTANEAKMKKAGGDFESILLASMWKSMKESFSDPKDGDTDPASGTLSDWGIEVMSGAVGKSGGLGIGNLIVKYLEQHSPASAAADAKPALETANVFGKSADKNQ